MMHKVIYAHKLPTHYICMCGQKFLSEAEFIDHACRDCPCRLTPEEVEEMDFERWGKR